jgi:hypothetical protein
MMARPNGENGDKSPNRAVEPSGDGGNSGRKGSKGHGSTGPADRPDLSSHFGPYLAPPDFGSTEPNATLSPFPPHFREPEPCPACGGTGGSERDGACECCQGSAIDPDDPESPL